MSKKPIRVLIAEDSELYAQTIVEILGEDKRFDVIAVAQNGADAVRLTASARPDVVLMDVRMPVMDGLTAIEQIMDQFPTPILVMTSDPKGATGELSFEALRRGALDMLPKPSAWAGTSKEQAELRERLELLSRIPVVRRRVERPVPPTRQHRKPPRYLPNQRVVGIVSSTGGPVALSAILRRLPATYPFPIVIVQHLSDDFAAQFASWLSSACSLKVKVAAEGDKLDEARVFIAPSGAHLLFDSERRLRFDPSPPFESHRPSGTLFLRSLAEHVGTAAVGCVLSGMGADGAAGLLAVKRAGGSTFVQDEASSVVFGMPRAALDLGAATRALPLRDIADELVLLARVPQGGGRDER